MIANLEEDREGGHCRFGSIEVKAVLTHSVYVQLKYKLQVSVVHCKSYCMFAVIVYHYHSNLTITEKAMSYLDNH